MKKKALVFAVFCVTLGFSSFAQKYIDKSGTIDIFSQTSMFIIEAKNQKVASVLNVETGDVVASTLVRSFKFHEALVEDHFNENYMESHLHPKAVFKGKITNIKDVDFTKDGKYDITIDGSLTMHGQSNAVKSTGTITVKAGNALATTVFEVSLEAYKIKVEESYKDRIKDEIKLTINFNYAPYVKK